MMMMVMIVGLMMMMEFPSITRDTSKFRSNKWRDVVKDKGRTSHNASKQQQEEQHHSKVV